MHEVSAGKRCPVCSFTTGFKRSPDTGNVYCDYCSAPADDSYIVELPNGAMKGDLAVHPLDPNLLFICGGIGKDYWIPVTSGQWRMVDGAWTRVIKERGLTPEKLAEEEKREPTAWEIRVKRMMEDADEPPKPAVEKLPTKPLSKTAFGERLLRYDLEGSAASPAPKYTSTKLVFDCDDSAASPAPKYIKVSGKMCKRED